jgi:hypothetical protein
MSLKIEQLAIELAAIAKSVGLRKTDAAGLKRLVESLAVSDAKKENQVGYARIARTYTATGYSRLHNLVLRYWQEDKKAEDFPDIPTTSAKDSGDTTCHSFLLTLSGQANMLQICNYISSHLANLLGARVDIKSVAKITEQLYDFLICGPVNPMAVLAILTKIGGIVQARLRSRFDYEESEIETPLLEWSVPDFVPLVKNDSTT